MKGQWIGKYTGASTGRIIVNIDELSSYFQGIAYLFEDAKNIPSVAAYFRTIDKNKTSCLSVENKRPAPC
ncbi:MAG: hypothetical protein CXR30_08685, partial [Geobacter sp.]